MEIVNEVILHAFTVWWILPLLFLFCLIDGFLPVLPSEALIVALASVAVASGSPSLVLLGITGAVGAVAGDQLASGIGRRIGLDRFRWMHRRRARLAFGFARGELERRGALLVFTARYIPIGRVVVNFTAGATRFSRRRFTLLDVLGCLAWSTYSTAIGAVGGHAMKDNPLLGIGLSIAIAMVFGFIVDRVLNVLRSRLGEGPRSPDAHPAPPLLEVPADSRR